MSPRDTIERVVDVLQRADSLFATPESPAVGTVEKVQQSAEACNGVAGQSSDMAGDLTDAHHELLTSIAQRLSQYAANDTQLVEQLGRVAESHAQSAARAAEVAHDTSDACERLSEWSEIPAAEIVTLTTLRRAVAEMQSLMTQQSGESMRTTEDIIHLNYE